MDKKKSKKAKIESEPMTSEESFKYIEILESKRFAYDDWELSRDIAYVTKYDLLIESCDPRVYSRAL